jgi:CHAT domain-containing protein/tetratricopeptide (TPR) repeat protein
MDRRIAVLAAVFLGQGGALRAQDVQALLRTGRYAEAEVAARAEVATAEAGSPMGASALETLAEALVRNGRVAGGEAARTARAALTARTTLHGPDARETARALTVLGEALLAEGLPGTAAAPIDRAVGLLRAAGTDAAPALLAQAELRVEQGDARAAIAAAREARALFQGENPSAAARALDVEAFALQSVGEWDEAGRALREALRLRESAATHPDSVGSYLLLGDENWRTGLMANAGVEYARAVDLADAALRRGHPLRTRASARLASWEAASGQIDRAIPRHRAALDEARENLGPLHPRVGDYLNDLANALVHSGDAAAAIGPLEEAVGLVERTYGAESSLLATPLYNLALARTEQGAWEQAAPPLERAMTLWRAAYGARDARMALSYVRWGDVLAAGGRDADAVSYYERALAIRLGAGEVDHPETASLQGRLALALERLGRTVQAERNAARAEAQLSRFRQWRDREYAEVVALRARLALATPSRRAAGLQRASDSDEVMRGHVRSTVRFLGDRQALEYVGHRFAGRDAVLAYVAAHPQDRAAARIGLDLVARSRNLVLDELASRSVRGAATREGASARERTARAAERMATHIYSGVAHKGAAGEALLREAQAEFDEAERAEALTAVRAPERERAGDLVAAVAARLPAGAALVSVCAYRPSPESPEQSYVAFVLAPGAHGPAVVPLGRAVPIDGLVREWHSAVERLARTREGGRAGRTEVDRLGRRLGEALWTPVARRLGVASRVVLVPDGSLNLLNFAALVDASGRYVLETGPTVHLVSGERDLLREAPAPGERRLLVVANPAFEDGRALARDGAPAPAAPMSPAVTGGTMRGGAPCAPLADLQFAPLVESHREALALAELWRRVVGGPSDVLEGSDASEAGFERAAPGHAIVHLATHGFVTESECVGTAEARARISPLLLSGVALAGANRRASAAAGEDDGILTAEEIAGLDLRSADWVVLSGCDTGRGAVRDSEGVAGLRRALAVAGARTVIMSLWAVADDDARQWMVDLYTARFQDGLETPEAVRRASLRALARLRAEGAADDPSRWAAFVAAGDLR